MRFLLAGLCRVRHITNGERITTFSKLVVVDIVNTDMLREGSQSRCQTNGGARVVARKKGYRPPGS